MFLTAHLLNWEGARLEHVQSTVVGRGQGQALSWREQKLHLRRQLGSWPHRMRRKCSDILDWGPRGHSEIRGSEMCACLSSLTLRTGRNGPRQSRLGLDCLKPWIKIIWTQSAGDEGSEGVQAGSDPGQQRILCLEGRSHRTSAFGSIGIILFFNFLL